MRPLSVPVRLVLGLLSLAALSSVRADEAFVTEIAESAKADSTLADVRAANSTFYLRQIGYALTVLDSRSKTALKKKLLRQAIAETRTWKNVRDNPRVLDHLKEYDGLVDSESFFTLRTELAFIRATLWVFQ
ncbi:MAG: hypothetical protein JST04_13220 [Bdellovibrionales bacterium]|nr:hypothetical protein [Bdellovibrionales bacterium]